MPPPQPAAAWPDCSSAGLSCDCLGLLQQGRLVQAWRPRMVGELVWLGVVEDAAQMDGEELLLS